MHSERIAESMRAWAPDLTDDETGFVFRTVVLHIPEGASSNEIAHQVWDAAAAMRVARTFAAKPRPSRGRASPAPTRGSGGKARGQRKGE